MYKYILEDSHSLKKLLDTKIEQLKELKSEIIEIEAALNEKARQKFVNMCNKVQENRPIEDVYNLDYNFDTTTDGNRNNLVKNRK